MGEPLARCLAIMETRAYERAYRAVEQAENPQAVPGSMAEMVRRTREQMNRERLQRQGGYEASDAPWRRAGG